MLKVTFYSFLLFISFISGAQIKWSTNFETAKAIAASENKLLLIDFTAVWCGPCRAMDKSLWVSEQLNDLNNYVIPVKVDIDYAENRNLALNFDVNSIPRVILVTPWEDKVWDQLGYRGPDLYLEALTSLPGNITSIYSAYRSDTENPEELMQLGLAYQNEAVVSKSDVIKRGFLMLSDQYLSQASKKVNSDDVEKKIDLYRYLNMAYLGKADKAIKKLSKMDESDADVQELLKHLDIRKLQAARH